ncbi:hypothetical protein [Ralstonia solanacearum]|uniref:hypothetical protein n=1 Tax=Ralstonia solanacearum TaxID=305 RepID=UPI00168B9610|nr:hypothetical protein [Ralstonia solanacearum]QNT25531.1 hypothetical protein C2I38_26105 [Ralstonia solanacearum]QNT63172.1 hypothetical protein C2L97_26100 [Ralstonia solanacearum]
MDTKKQQKVSLALPSQMLEKIEAQRRDMSQRVGVELSFNQAATSLLHRALSQSEPVSVSG